MTTSLPFSFKSFYITKKGRGTRSTIIARFQFCLWFRKFLKGVCPATIGRLSGVARPLSRYQCGFRHKYSTQSTFKSLCDSIRRNLAASQLTGAIFVHFRNAFDNTDHKILVDELQLFGIYDSEHRWMTDLTDRTQSVFVGGVLGCPQQVVSGVPQGFTLGPLFSLYVTDLSNCFASCQCVKAYFGTLTRCEIVRVNASLGELRRDKEN